MVTAVFIGGPLHGQEDVNGHVNVKDITLADGGRASYSKKAWTTSSPIPEPPVDVAFFKHDGMTEDDFVRRVMEWFETNE